MIKETGEVDTSWYSEDKREFILSKPKELAGLSMLTNQENPILFKNLTMTGKVKGIYKSEEIIGNMKG